MKYININEVVDSYHLFTLITRSGWNNNTKIRLGYNDIGESILYERGESKVLHRHSIINRELNRVLKTRIEGVLLSIRHIINDIAYDGLNSEISINKPFYTRRKSDIKKSVTVRMLLKYLKVPSSFFDLMSLEHHVGSQREVYLDNVTGFGYKVPLNVNKFRKVDLERLSSLASEELRLNNIYKSPGFYDGKYKKYAFLRLIPLELNNGNIVNSLMFPIIKGAVQ